MLIILSIDEQSHHLTLLMPFVTVLAVLSEYDDEGRSA